MDFRMDKASWLMIVFILATLMYFMVQGSVSNMETIGYLQMFGFAVLMTLVLIALMCIPVLIICYFIKRIPDIDYSVWAATLFVVIGIVSEIV